MTEPAGFTPNNEMVLPLHSIEDNAICTPTHGTVFSHNQHNLSLHRKLEIEKKRENESQSGSWLKMHQVREITISVPE